MNDQKKILKVLKSTTFKFCLNSINRNYSNLKQENQIRNALLEILNGDEYLENSHKAFAEHPREKGNRVDLSIIDENEFGNAYTVEFKFQFAKDYDQFLGFKSCIVRDFERVIRKKQADLFILIVCEWNKAEKREFDRKWGIDSDLSRYLCDGEEWKNNIKNLFSEYINCNTDEFAIEVDEPYKTKYSFFIISRNKSEINPYQAMQIEDDNVSVNQNQ
jgi:hypothetical protein